MSVTVVKNITCTDGRSMQEILKDFVKPILEEEKKPRHWIIPFFPDEKEYKINLLDFDNNAIAKNNPEYIFPVEYHDKALCWYGRNNINKRIDETISKYFSDLIFEVITIVETDVMEHYLLKEGRKIKDFLKEE